MWTKVSICFFLLRIPVSKKLIRPLQAAIVILFVSNMILTVLWIVQCRPIAATWDTSVKGDFFSREQLLEIIFSQASEHFPILHDIGALTETFIVISAVSDFALSAFPILILYKVQISLQRKIGLCIPMGLGVM